MQKPSPYSLLLSPAEPSRREGRPPGSPLGKLKEHETMVREGNGISLWGP